MLEERDPAATAATASSEPLYRSRLTGRPVTRAERIAAARVRVVIDPKRGVVTPQWIVELAKQSA